MWMASISYSVTVLILLLDLCGYIIVKGNPYLVGLIAAHAEYILLLKPQPNNKIAVILIKTIHQLYYRLLEHL